MIKLQKAYLVLLIMGVVRVVALRETDPRAEKYPGEQLLFAAGEGDSTQVARLLEKGVDVHTVNEYGETALHTACIRGSPETMRALLAAPGAPVNARATAVSSLRMTPLHWCAAHGHTEAAELLLDHGARLTMMCDSANRGAGEVTLVTALDLALEAGHEKMAQMLEGRGGQKSRNLRRQDNYDDVEDPRNAEL